jgi:CheY-like chemotaxis protein
MSGRKILIVDDNIVLLKTLSTRLGAAGYEILTARDGGEAINAVREQRPDVILLDLNFPPDVAHGGGVAWDGFLLISWLGRMEETRNTPIIVITGEDPEKCEAKMRALGAVSFVRKPISPRDLLEAIQHALQSIVSVAPTEGVASAKAAELQKPLKLQT